MKSPKQGIKAMPTTRVIAVNGIELFLRERGTGPLIQQQCPDRVNAALIGLLQQVARQAGNQMPLAEYR